MNGPVGAPHGVVGGTGIGGGTRAPNSGVTGKVASAGIPGMTTPVAVQQVVAKPVTTELEVLSKPPVQYTSEAKQLRVQGEVILRVTFTATGQVLVQSVVHGLGHGLDEEARRVAQQIRFRPATRNGQAIDMTTNITITFQLA
jgi:TonB family protein